MRDEEAGAEEGGLCNWRRQVTDEEAVVGKGGLCKQRR